jgi:MYXO-CTERM domain-containing protein
MGDFMKYILAATLAAIIPSGAQAATLVVEDVSHFVDRVGTRSFGSDNAEKIGLTFGVYQISLDSTEGTSGTYEQNGVTGSLFDVSSSIDKQFGERVPYDPTLTGAWTLTFENDGDITVFVTPEVGDAEAPDFVTGVARSGSGVTPTFTFTPPPSLGRIQIDILDLEQARVSAEIPDKIYSQNLDPSATSFTVPAGLLKEDGAYSVIIQADTYRDAEFDILGRSRVYYDFTTGELPDTGGAPIFLPQTDTTSGTPIFNFDNAVLKDVLGFYDPFVAVGYDYAIGEGDPLFASVLLPDIGDGLFDLLLSDGSGGYDFAGTLQAGVEHLFDDGVSIFRILGIEISAGLDPVDATAFVTGLSFNGDGRFTGTMTPISVEVSPVPLPGSAGLLLGGLALLVARRRRMAT